MTHSERVKILWVVLCLREEQGQRSCSRSLVCADEAAENLGCLDREQRTLAAPNDAVIQRKCYLGR